MACALALQRAGFSTTLLDRDDAKRAASWGNAGHIAIEQVTPLASYANVRSVPRRLAVFGGPVGLPLRAASSWLPFGLRLLRAAGPKRFQQGQIALTQLLTAALPAWRRLTKQIGQPGQLRERGHFIAWESQRTAQAGLAHWLSACASGATGNAVVRAASANELSELKQRFNHRPVGAAAFEGTGQILELSQTRAAMVAHLIQAGGRYCVDEAIAIERQNNRAAIVTQASAGRGSAASLHADKIVIAAGIGSAALFRSMNQPIALIAERGYHLDGQVTAQQWPSDLAPVAFEDRSVIVTRFTNSLRLAGFTEFANELTAPDKNKWARLHQHAGALGLPLTESADQWHGARPTLPDYLPAIGKSTVATNLYYAFGHQHLGLTLAAITGELVAQMILEVDSEVPLGPFDLQRFN